jgi:hypothetical protein
MHGQTGYRDASATIEDPPVRASLENELQSINLFDE